MAHNRRRAKKASPRPHDIDLSADNVSNDSDYSRSSSPESQGGSDQHSSDPTPVPSDDEQPHARSSQAKNARSPHWQSWEDRYLAQAVDETRPFLLPPSERKAGWNRTADVLYRNSCAAGPRFTSERSGSACKNRFMKLMKEHKKGETESRMKTGAVEEISEHIKLMTELQAIMDDHNDSAKKFSGKSKQKSAIEAKAGQELWDAAMMGLARREGLIDVSELDGSSIREKQGQRKRRRPLLPSNHQNRTCSLEGNDSEVEPPPKRRRRSTIQDVLQQRNEEDCKRLKEARMRADRQHGDLLHAQNATLNAITNPTNEIKGFCEDNPATRDAADSSRTTEILAQLVTKKF
ncbi:hypothetical protein DFH08DRAFT_975300 [Mycena albidolilacea]|uniref:Myb-like domain-containing protein n=1 Tax=Mycena albidolilacea TaxID=1033008 RepID=A0AAD6Z5J8_9AGAR|nr:hypothetical protein DFH08DRAFT_975300 [Mycena albidolilacea]